MRMLNWTSWCEALFLFAKCRGLTIKSLVERSFRKHSNDFGWFRVQGHKLGGHGGAEAVYNRVMQTLLPRLLTLVSILESDGFEDLIKEINGWIDAQSKYFSREISGGIMTDINDIYNHF